MLTRPARISLLPLLFSLATATACLNESNPCQPDDFSCRPELGVYFYLEALKDQSENYRRLILSEDSLVAYWRLDETQGTNAEDLKNDIDGTYENGVSFGQEGAIYGTDMSVGLDGVDDVITVPHDERLNFQANDFFTLEAWVQVANTQNDTGAATNEIIGKGSNESSFPYSLRYNNTTGRIEFERNDGSASPGVNSSFALNTEVFYHVVAVRAGNGKLHMYVNGELKMSADDDTSASNGVTNTNTITFGRRSGGDRPFTGLLDEIAIYDTAISAETILTHYQYGVGLLTEY